jgi:hypothetical protein
MFGVTQINAPSIQPLGATIDHLRELAQDHEIAYGVVYLSPSTHHFASVRYVRNQDDLEAFLKELDTMYIDVGDVPLVTDVFLVAYAPDEAGLIDFTRGFFEYAMGFHALGEPDLVPLDEISALLASYYSSGLTLVEFVDQQVAGRSGTTGATGATGASRDAEIIEQLLRSLEGKRPEDFGRGVS